jgi:hypothetical protein
MTKKFYDFMCRCGGDQEQAWKESQQSYQWALDHLGCEPGELVSYVIYHLLVDYSVHKTDVIVDQWAAVSAANKSYSTFVQCDRVEDGYARTLQLFVENAEKEEF